MEKIKIKNTQIPQ